MIRVSNLWKVFGTRKVDEAIARSRNGDDRHDILRETGCAVSVRDVSFEVAKGETFVVMGLSGSGKSTLIRCMSRLIEPTTGEITVDGRDLLGMNAEQLRELRRSKMSMVFQHFGLFPHRRVIDNAAYGLEVKGMSKPARRARAEEVLELVGLKGWSNHYPQQLSGGMQQRVGLARALALDPEILFFDEPFSALDPLIRRDMQSELLRLQQTQQRTIVFITHDFAEAIRLGDRIAILKDGSFDQIGTPEQIVAHPATDYVREFTTDIPRAKVLTARTVMRHDALTLHGDVNGLRRMPEATTIDVLVPLMLDRDEPILLVDGDGAPAGLIDRADVLAVLGELPR